MEGRMTSRTLPYLLSLVAVLAASGAAADADGKTRNGLLASLLSPLAGKKVAYAPANAAATDTRASFAGGDTLVFSAPPRETPEEGAAVYGPVAEYLSGIIGRKIAYKHPGTWGAYRSEMLKGSYDLVFDGPHFNAYRAEKLNHNILVKAPEIHEFAVIVKNDGKFNTLSQTAGRAFCAHAPPNLGTLVLLSQFDNPARQPVIASTEGWEQIYEGVAAGRCAGGVLPMANLKKLDKSGRAMKVLHTSLPMQNQAFSAGPRLTAEEQLKLVAALTASTAAAPTAKLRAVYKIGPQFVAASNREYAGLSQYLRSEWGYY
jgi:ABC-type phosphate/phosphonate transport system substrate-binding protein